MDDKILELLVIEEKLKRERERYEDRPFLQLEIEEPVKINKNKPEVEPKRVIVIEL